MVDKIISIIICLLIGSSLIACGPSQAELDTQATQVAANLAATQTTEVPTPTSTTTSTHTPIPTVTPTQTPTSTNTPTLTPTYTPTSTSTPTVTNTPTAVPTATHAPTLTPSPTIPPPPTATALFETPYVLGNLQLQFIPYGENVTLPEPPIEVTLLLFRGEEEIRHKITDPTGDFALTLNPGEYALSVDVEAPSMSPEPIQLFIEVPHFTVPPTGCNYLGRILLSFYRLPPGGYAEHRATIIELEEKTGINTLFTYLSSGHLVPESFVVNLPNENERVEGAENCSIKLAEF